MIKILWKFIYLNRNVKGSSDGIVCCEPPYMTTPTLTPFAPSIDTSACVYIRFTFAGARKINMNVKNWL